MLRQNKRIDNSMFVLFLFEAKDCDKEGEEGIEGKAAVAEEVEDEGLCLCRVIH